MLLLLLLLLLLFTAIGFSPGGSSPYTSTYNTNGHIIYIKVTIQNKLYTITKSAIDRESCLRSIEFSSIAH
jgi:hypothetical protein